MNEENIRTSRCRDSIESDAIDCPVLLHPYFNLVSNHQVPLNFVSFDTLHPKEDITINVICERNDFDS